ncbi:MAG TPA: DEAD/DEAH box helicase [Bacteroidota bacterium]|nr:DEAD/DEAH box helicase [Bacteroidota bacterium]
MHTFESLGVGKATLHILTKHGIVTPTPIQELCLPHLFSGKDVVAQAETGSGKTLGFALPLIERIESSDPISALILAPTRELAVQISREFEIFSHAKRLSVTAVYGGVASAPQVKKLQKTQIIVATPGRLLDLLQQGVMRLSTVRFLVLDEADRMLDMGFLPDIERVIRQVPRERQTMLFSATISKEIEKIGRRYLQHPIDIRLASELKPEFLRQTYYQTHPEAKLPLLIHLLKADRDLAIVFCNRKHIARKIASKLAHQGVHARPLQGDMSQNQRERATEDFKSKKFTVLVATDVAARGLHIDDITHVYNYEIPKDVDSFTHRVGRTARAGKRGEAISLVATDEDKKFFKQILFNYNGQIALKSVNPGDLPVIAESPRGERPAPRHGGQQRRRRFQR